MHHVTINHLLFIAPTCFDVCLHHLCEDIHLKMMQTDIETCRGNKQ
jgi:hypothetical protein